MGYRPTLLHITVEQIDKESLEKIRAHFKLWESMEWETARTGKLLKAHCTNEKCWRNCTCFQAMEWMVK